MDWLKYPFRRAKLYFNKRAFEKCVRDEATEEFLKMLLNLMQVTFLVDRKLRKHIEGFNGLIQFRSKDNAIRVLAEFKNDRLAQRELAPGEELKIPPNVTVTYKDADALMNFLLPRGGKRDILRSLLKNEVILEGNFNYIYRFGFIANHLQLKLAGVFE